MMEPPPRARKSLGQNFLHDPRIIARIAGAIAPQHDDVMVEIGPGRGALTSPLTDQLDHLHVVEYDRLLAARLAEQFDKDRVTIHNIDVLKFDFASVGNPLRVVGNLPYQISSPLLFRLVEIAPRLADMVFMLQKEFVDRMVASHTDSAYGRLSVMLARVFESRRLFDVGPGAFKPAPKVHSSVVRLVPRADGELDTGDPALFAELVRLGFVARRKTLGNALKSRVSGDDFASAGIDSKSRAENLSPEDWARLSRHLSVAGDVDQTSQ